MNATRTAAENDDGAEATRSVGLVIRSHGPRQPWVRVGRSIDVASGCVSIQLTQEGVFVACASTAAVQAQAQIGRHGGPILAITLREGDIELAIDGATEMGAEMRALPAPAPSLPVPDAEWDSIEIDPNATLTDVPSPFHTQPKPGAPTTATAAAPAGAALPRPTSVLEDPGDAPTRIGPERAPFEAFEAGESAARAEPADPTPRRRMRKGVVRFALLAMLASAAMLWMHVRRLHAMQSAHRVHAPAVSSAPSPVGLAPRPVDPQRPAPVDPQRPAPVDPQRRAPVDPQRPAPVDPPSIATPGTAPATAAPPAPAGSARRPVTRARSAADALANGAYADAVRLYSSLSAEPGANPAYAQIVQNLQTRQPAPL